MNLKQIFPAFNAVAEPQALPTEATRYPFPEGFIDRLRLDLQASGKDLPEAVGVQVGLETTRLSSFLLAHGAQFFAVEAEEARRVAAARLCSSWPTFQLFAGAPNATRLDDQSVDFIVSDRALYWPDQPGVRREFTRILRPGGVVALVTDNRVYTGGEQSQEFEDLLRSHCPSFREKRQTQDIGRLVASLFQEGDVFEDAFTGSHTLGLEDFLDQTSCMPVYPGETDPVRPLLAAALKRYFTRWAKKGRLTIPTVCRIAVGHLAPEAA